MMPDDEQRKMFDATANQPVAWSMTAADLLVAADDLRTARDRREAALEPRRGFSTHSVELMLRGFAIECLTKALWRKQGNQLSSNGEFQDVKNAGAHNLVQLMQAVGLSLNDSEKDVLKRLSLYMVGAGRYPIPRSWEARRIRKLHGGGWGIPEFWRTPSDDTVVSSILDRIESELGWRCVPEW